MNNVSAFILLLLYLLSGGIEKAHAQIVVVVNSENPIHSLSVVDLKRIYLIERTMWEFSDRGPVGIRVVAHNGKVGTASTFYNRVLGFSQARLRLVWLGKMLNGELHRLPLELASDADVLKYVQEDPGAITFVDAVNFDSSLESVKALRIEGKVFKDEAYPIQYPLEATTNRIGLLTMID